jgi:thioredoxin 1
MLLNRRVLVGAAASLAAAFVVMPIAFAAATAFDKAAFQAAQKAGKPILVEISAPWCPTCKAQAPILSELSAQPKFKDLVRFTVDFDSQKPIWSEMKVQMQSTLIVYKGDKEVGRSVGETKKEALEALLAKVL